MHVVCALLHDKDTITQCRTKIIVSFTRRKEWEVWREIERGGGREREQSGMAYENRNFIYPS